MSLFDVFKTSIKNEDPTDWIPDFIVGDETAKRSYLKIMVKATVLDFVARTMSTMEVKFKDFKDGPEWEYILNVRPNNDTSAATFWYKFFYQLIDENEALILFTDDNQFLLADDFSREEKAVYEDIFTNVSVKDYVFKRSFRRSEVLYFEYNNENLERFTKGLFNDYSELFGRILEVAMRNNQIRGTVAIETTGSMNDEKGKDDKTRAERLQNFINKIYELFSKNTVAIVPSMKGFTYEEYTNKQGVSNQWLDELNKMKSSLIDDVSNPIGISTALIYAEKLELDSNIKAMRKTFTDLLAKKVKDELTSGIITKAGYVRGERLKVTNILPRNIIEDPVKIDKVVSTVMNTGS
ncbi:phage portal protein [Vagococcus carniphilus]|uniref:phage portal protein n=1 Tax=Vagococcus carniphilus TaxID=218144 RepID=UPI003B5B5265